MTKKAAKRLLPKVPDLPGTRRQQYSASTRKSLISAASEQFTERGYGNTSLEAIASAAEVTKGALYHHFTGKQAVFEAVFTEVEKAASAGIRSAVDDTSDPWEKSIIGLRAFLEVVQDPTYRRIVMQDGPAVLGYERFREQEERSSYRVLRSLVDTMLDSGPWELDADMRETFTRIFQGAVASAGESVASSEDPEEASQRVETVIQLILAGLRSLADEGTPSS